MESGSTKRSLEKLEEMISIYGSDWTSWSTSNLCPLSKKELEVINSYRSTRTHSLFGTANHISLAKVRSQYTTAVNKIRSGKAINSYKIWVVHQRMIEAGIINQEGKPPTYLVPLGKIQMDIDVFCRLYEAVISKNVSMVTEHDLNLVKLLNGLSLNQLEAEDKSSLFFELRLTSN